MMRRRDYGEIGARAVDTIRGNKLRSSLTVLTSKPVCAAIRSFRPELGIGIYAVKYGDRKAKDTLLEGERLPISIRLLPCVTGNQCNVGHSTFLI
jgi:hypothetical protein